LVLGFLFACHGAQKLFGVLGGHRELHDPVRLVAGLIEFGGGILIAVGLFTRVGAFIASGEMAVAYFMAHAGRGFWPIVNKGELAVVYCFFFLFIAAHGDGPFSVRAAIRREAPRIDVSTNPGKIISPGRRRAIFVSQSFVVGAECAFCRSVGQSRIVKRETMLNRRNVNDDTEWRSIIPGTNAQFSRTAANRLKF
jgi:putative oxidoreductase